MLWWRTTRKKQTNSTTAQRDTRAHRAHKRPPTRTAVAQQAAPHAQQTTHAITEHEGKVHGQGRLQRRLRKPMISSSAADARPINCKSNVVPLAITRTNGPRTHTSDDSYIYQLSLVLATATISYILVRPCPNPSDMCSRKKLQFDFTHTCSFQQRSSCSPRSSAGCSL